MAIFSVTYFLNDPLVARNYKTDIHNRKYLILLIRVASGLSIKNLFKTKRFFVFPNKKRGDLAKNREVT